ncbi:MAG: SGNH/GDSL hydrolase family protein [bacterium]
MLTAVAIFLGVLIVGEIAVRVFYPKPPRWKEPQVRTVLDRRCGYLNRPNQKAYTMDAPVTINSFGFRGPEFEVEKSPDSLRILGVGNSLSFGAGVADDETYLAYLNSQLQGCFPDKKVEVLNGAIIGFTIRQYLPFLKSVLPRLKPNIVLLGAHWRDLHFNPRFGQLTGQVDSEAWKMIKKKFDDRNLNNGAEGRLKTRLIKRAKDAMRHWRFVYVCSYHLTQLKDRIKPPNFKLWQKSFLSGEETEPIRQRRVEARKTLERMKSICDENDISFGVVLFPDSKQITRDYPASSWPSILTEICKDLNIPHVLLLPAIQRAHQKYGNAIFVPYDITHFCAPCNEVIAGAVYDFLHGERFLVRRTEPQESVA